MKEPRELPGTPLSREEMEGVTHVRAEPSIRYAWSIGIAMTRFLDELRQGRFIGRECHRCARILFPPRMFCEQCFRPTNAWRMLENTGSVETFSVSYLDTDANRIEKPILVGVISIDGASPKMGLMHYYNEVEPDDLRIGMAVEAIWKEPAEREGAVTDIKYFRPISGDRS